MGFLRSSNTALSRIQHELNHLMSMKPWDDFEDELFTLGTDWVPAVDVKTEKSHYLVRADVPGVNPDDIDVRLDNELLTIRGSRKDEKKTEELSITFSIDTARLFQQARSTPMGHI